MAYRKEVFDPATLKDAMHTVLTSDPENPMKFMVETNRLVQVILNSGVIKDKSTLLDFGCGMGRVSKEILNRVNCNIIGLDISEVMLGYANDYVDDVRFTTTTTYTAENSIDVALSILVLQHTEFPEKEIQNIHDVLKPNGIFVLVNESYRLVPADINADGWVIWHEDGINIYELCASKFKEVARSNKAGGLDVILFKKEVE